MGQKQIDTQNIIENHLNVENLLFGDTNNICIDKKVPVFQNNKLNIFNIGGSSKLSVPFYKSISDNIKSSLIGMCSSGTTKGSQSLVFRSKKSIINEILLLHHWYLPYLKNKKIFIAVTPQHSFGLIPALLTSRLLSTDIFIFIGTTPLEIIPAIKKLQPQIIFAIPLHIRILCTWLQKSAFSIQSLERIIFGGTPLHSELIDLLKKKKNIMFTQLYGTTQTGVIAINDDVKIHDPLNCGAALKRKSITFSSNNNEITISNEDGIFKTGDSGYLNEDGDLIVKGRIDSVIYKEGNKIDLTVIQELIKKSLGSQAVKIDYEKNINNKIELICTLPSEYKLKKKYVFEKIKTILPFYCIPNRYYFK